MDKTELDAIDKKQMQATQDRADRDLAKRLGVDVDELRKYGIKAEPNPQPPVAPEPRHEHHGFPMHITKDGRGVWDKNCPECAANLQAAPEGEAKPSEARRDGHSALKLEDGKESR